jgi:hypothetical protein
LLNGVHQHWESRILKQMQIRHILTSQYFIHNRLGLYKQ